MINPLYICEAAKRSCYSSCFIDGDVDDRVAPKFAFHLSNEFWLPIQRATEDSGMRAQILKPPSAGTKLQSVEYGEPQSMSA